MSNSDSSDVRNHARLMEKHPPTPPGAQLLWTAVVDVDETTGAGDSFLAGFLHQLCQRGLDALEQAEEIGEIVTYASAVGALTATRPGAIAAQPTRAEVEAFLHLYYQDS